MSHWPASGQVSARLAGGVFHVNPWWLDSSMSTGLECRPRRAVRIWVRTASASRAQCNKAVFREAVGSFVHALKRRLLFRQPRISTETFDEYKYSLPRRGSPFKGLGVTRGTPAFMIPFFCRAEPTIAVAALLPSWPRRSVRQFLLPIVSLTPCRRARWRSSSLCLPRTACDFHSAV